MAAQGATITGSNFLLTVFRFAVASWLSALMGVTLGGDPGATGGQVVQTKCDDDVARLLAMMLRVPDGKLTEAVRAVTSVGSQIQTRRAEATGDPPG